MAFSEDRFKSIASLKNISIPDSFVSREQKLGKGNGETKLYVGHKSREIYNFFGRENFKIRCFLRKSNLITTMADLKDIYNNSNIPFRKSDLMPGIYILRMKKIDEFEDEFLFFDLHEQNQIRGPRLYVNSKDESYKLIREICIPKICNVSFTKMTDNNEIVFAIDLFSSPSDRLSLIEEYSNAGNQNFHESVDIDNLEGDYEEIDEIEDYNDDQEEFEFVPED